MTVLNLQITDDNDDGYDSGTDFGFGDPTYAAGYAIQFELRRRPGFHYSGGFRFPGVTIPNAATINSATFTIHVIAVAGSSTDLYVYANDVDNAAAFSTTNRPQHASWTRTTASAVTASGTTADVDVAFNVASIVQEIVDRAGWVSGNAIAFEVDMDAAETYNTITVRDQEDEFAQSAAGATLDIDYTAGGGGGSQHFSLPVYIIRRSKR